MARHLPAVAAAAAAVLALSACAPAPQAAEVRPVQSSSSPTSSPSSCSDCSSLPTPSEDPVTSPSATPTGYEGPYSLPQPPVAPGQPPAAGSVEPLPVRELPAMPVLPPSTPSPAATTAPPTCAPADAITATLTAVRMSAGGLVFTLQYKNSSAIAEKITSATAYIHDNVTFYQQAVKLIGTAAPTVPAHGTAEADYGYQQSSAAGERSLGLPVSRWTAEQWQGGWSSYPCPPIGGVENWVSEP